MEAIEKNKMYYDTDEANAANEALLPPISEIVLHSRSHHIRKDYDQLVELVTYLTVKLG